MLSEQCDRLRRLVQIFDDECFPNWSQEVEEAADTILRLRNDCVELHDKNMKLCHDNDGLRQLCKDMYLFMALAESFDMLRISTSGKDDLTMDEFRRRMAKHGIEVGE